jgi:hypothetical protein
MTGLFVTFFIFKPPVPPPEPHGTIRIPVGVQTNLRPGADVYHDEYSHPYFIRKVSGE